jgi:hypothetical protein
MMQTSCDLLSSQPAVYFRLAVQVNIVDFDPSIARLRYTSVYRNVNSAYFLEKNSGNPALDTGLPLCYNAESQLCFC